MCTVLGDTKEDNRMKRKKNKNVRRDNITIAKTLHNITIIRPRIVSPKSTIKNIIPNDKRYFTPVKYQSDKIQIANNPIRQTKNALVFSNKKLPLCQRRQIRKSVIFALGKNGAGNAKPKFNQQSKIGCK